MEQQSQDMQMSQHHGAGEESNRMNCRQRACKSHPLSTPELAWGGAQHTRRRHEERVGDFSSLPCRHQQVIRGRGEVRGC